MTKAVLYLVAGGLLSTMAVAQGAQPQGQGGVRTVVGCLAKVYRGQYVITAEGPGPKQFRVIGGDTSGLSRMQEHTVRVTGVVGTSDPAVQATTPPGPGSTTGATYNTIDLQQVQDVTSNCSVPGKESRK